MNKNIYYFASKPYEDSKSWDNVKYLVVCGIEQTIWIVVDLNVAKE